MAIEIPCAICGSHVIDDTDPAWAARRIFDLSPVEAWKGLLAQVRDAVRDDVRQRLIVYKRRFGL